MLLAHEAHCLGEAGARALYGEAVFEQAPEYVAWREHAQEPLGQPIGMRTCACAAGKGRGMAGACPRHRALVQRVVSAARWDEASLLAMVANPLPTGRRLEALVRSAMTYGMEQRYRVEQDLNRSRDRPVFGREVSFWPGEHAWEIARLQFVAALTGVAWDDSCLHPFKTLAENTSLAVLRERVCWLADKPASVSLNAAGKVHAERKPAVVFADLSALYANDGSLLPRVDVEQPEAIDLDMVDTADAQPIRRESLIRLVGVKNYLIRRRALAEAATDTATLWRLGAGALGERRLLEVFETDRLGSDPGITYYELPDTVKTIEAALQFSREPDDVVRLVIET